MWLRMNTSAPVSTSGQGDQLIPVSQAATLLAVHISTLRRWIRQGKLPAYRVGDKGIRVHYGDVLRLLTPLPAGTPQKGRHVKATEEAAVTRCLTKEEQTRGLAALGELRRLRVKDLKRRGGKPYPDASDLIEQMREERTSGLMRASKE